MIRRQVIALGAVFVALLATAARASDQVQIRGAEHKEGYARIAVEWPIPVAFETKLEGDTLTIHFARPFTAPLTPLAHQIDSYAASVGQSADGTSIIVRLKKPIEIKTATVNETIAAIDLVVAKPSSAAAKPVANAKKPPDAGTPSAPALAELQAALGDAQPAADTASAPAGPATPEMGAPINLLASTPLKSETNAEPAIPASKASPPPAPRETVAQAAQAPRAGTAPGVGKVPSVDQVQVRGAEHDGFGRIAFEWPGPVEFDAKLDGDTLNIRFARAFTAPLGPLLHQLDHYLAGVAQSSDGKSVQARLKRPVEIKTALVSDRIVSIDLVAKPVQPEKPPAKAAKTKTPDAKLPAKAQDQKAAAPAKKETAKPEPAKPETQNPLLAETVKPPAIIPPQLPAASAVPAPAPDVAPAVRPTAPSPPRSRADQAAAGMTPIDLAPVVAIENDRATLRFDWPMPVAAAVYRRGAALWIIFAAPARLNLAAARGRGQPILREIDPIPAEGAAALRLITADGVNPSLRRAGNSWIMEFKRQDAAPEAPIAVEPRPAGPTPAVELHARDAAPPVTLRDPVLGDQLTIVPIGDLGRGIDATRDFVDFRLLPTIQGVVIRPNADDLEVKTDLDTIRVTRGRGLILSDARDRVLGRAVAARHRIFDFASWRGPAQQSFIDRRSALERAIASSAPGARTRPRLDLARFYFANQFGAETLSVLAQIARDDPQAAGDPGMRALKGGACLLADNSDCAAQELNQPNLDNEPEAGLWRGSLAAAKADWPTASREFQRGAGLLPSYPKTLRNRFALEAAEAMLETDHASAGEPLLDLVLKDDPALGDQAMALYLQGRVEQQLGQLQLALERWTKVAGMGDRKARARALYARAMALYEAKKASRSDTIKTLDGLRFAWRGDEFEFTLLRRLGELKLADLDPEGGLDMLNLAASYFPDYPAAKDVGKEALDAFADVFLGATADDMPPVKALALYDAFHELVPPGERYDAIVKKLVDRLVAVDLLDRAAGLLGEQVKSHLTGVEKARAATQLALLRLMNQQPDAALAALDIDVNGGLTPELTRQRQELRARALMDLNRAGEALTMLNNDNSRDAYRLRADIYWRKQDWKSAARVFATLAGTPPGQAPLDPDTARVVLSWAAALALDGDQAGLTRLRQDWGGLMASSKNGDAFKVIAAEDNDGSGGGTPSEIASRIAQIGTLQNFMSAYKERLTNTKLSAIN